MPLYHFKNEKTDQIEEHFLSFSDLEDFEKNNKHLKRTLSTPKVISGTSTDSGKLPEGFKDTLREMKKKHPLGRGADHLV